MPTDNWGFLEKTTGKEEMLNSRKPERTFLESLPLHGDLPRGLAKVPLSCLYSKFHWGKAGTEAQGTMCQKP